MPNSSAIASCSLRREAMLSPTMHTIAPMNAIQPAPFDRSRPMYAPAAANATVTATSPITCPKTARESTASRPSVASAGYGCWYDIRPPEKGCEPLSILAEPDHPSRHPGGRASRLLAARRELERALELGLRV